MNKSFIQFSAAFLLAAVTSTASADVVRIAERSAFDALGTIAYNSNFDDFGAGFALPGDPFVRGGVTYVSDQNLTVGAGTEYSIGALRTVMSNNYFSGVAGTIAPAYTLFGFSGAVTEGTVDIVVTTNRASYTFAGIALANGASGFTFAGFQATGAGEYFTGFRIDTWGDGYLAGVTDVAVGVSAVPEPAMWMAMLGGLGLLAGLRRKAAHR